MERTLPNQKDNIQRRLRLIIKLGGECEECHNERDFSKLEIHHSNWDGGGRRKAAGGGSNPIREEVNDKLARESLEVLCFKCHAKLTKLMRSAAKSVRLSTRQACNILSDVQGKINTAELYQLVEAGKIRGELAGKRKRVGRYVFEAQALLDYACHAADGRIIGFEDKRDEEVGRESPG